MTLFLFALSTFGLSLRSAAGPAERAVLGFPWGLFQPATSWESASPGVWMGVSFGWRGERQDTLILFDDPTLDPDSIPFEIPIPLPTTTEMVASGGLSFLGGTFPTRWGILGMGTGNSFGNTVALNGTTVQQLTLDVTFQDTLTQQEIPDLDPQDRIPVSVSLSGSVDLSLSGDVSFSESRTPFLVHLVREKPWGGWGVALLLEDVRIRGEGSAGVGLFAAAQTQARTVVDTITGWALEGNFSGAFLDSTLATLSVAGELRAVQPSFGVGMLRRFRLWKFPIQTDAGIWGTLPVDASGNLSVRLLVPTTDPAQVDWTWDSLQVDTAGKVIRGGGTIEVGALRDTVVDVIRESGRFSLPGAWGARLGLALHWPLDILLSAAFTGKGGGVERTEILAGLGGTCRQVGLHLFGGLIHTRTTIGELVTGWLPVAYGGLRLEFAFSRFRVRTGFLYQSSQAVFQFLSEQGRLSRPIWLLALGYVP